MAQTIPLAIYLSVGVEQKCKYLNPMFIKLFGYTLEDIPTVKQWWPLAYPDENYSRQISEEWTTKVQRAIETQSPIEPMEVVVTCKDGSKKNISWGYITIGDKNYAYGLDLTERKQAEEKIQQMAYHDTLTGLPNRKLFSDRLGIALAQSQRNQKKGGDAMLDLDKFKDVNDTLGHDVGDLLLKASAERLSAELRKGDTVARFGGDEFALSFPDLKEREDMIQIAQKIVDSFHMPFLIGTHQLSVTASIGIAVYPQDGTDEDILLKNADIAMYQAKQTGRDRYKLYKKA
jgi:diguanylate cyclase (GGDEF)-like protein/PAS domain S-box-containing protein